MTTASNRFVPRIRTAVVWAGVMVVAVFLRSHLTSAWPAIVTRAAGDALWTTAVFLALRFVCTRAASPSLALLAFAISAAVEISQLSASPWLAGIRGTWIGSMAIGRDFHALDFIWYAIGAGFGGFLSRVALLEGR